MSTTRYASILGLGFGDCGKGHFVDALTRQWQAHTVVRCNGGAQAGHNVVTPANGSPGQHHTFSQFGAGTLVPGVRTVLLHPMVVHPTALLMEAEVLSRKGMHDCMPRLTIDAECLITTPYHQAAGRLRERLRGSAAHGTCGVGVGETVRHALEYPEQVFRYKDLSPASAAEARAQMDKLQMIRRTLLAGFTALCPAGSPASKTDDYRTLHDELLAEKWLNHGRALTRQCPPASTEVLRHELSKPGCVLFEGAQGVLLDEWRGFHPHTTWSSIHTAAVEAAAARVGIDTPMEHYGALRSYLTRHGAGPLPTHDESLDNQLPEPHNPGDGWQGRFRRGHPDAVLLQYALEAVGALSGLLVSHLDVFDRGVAFKWCRAYRSAAAPHATVHRLPLGPYKDLDHQTALTQLLLNARPVYAAEAVQSASDFLDRLAGITSLPIVGRSYGSTFAEVR